MKLTNKQVEKVKEFSSKNYLRIKDLGRECFELRRASNNYAFITKGEDGRFAISGCVYEKDLTLSQVLKVANKNL